MWGAEEIRAAGDARPTKRTCSAHAIIPGSLRAKQREIGTEESGDATLQKARQRIRYWVVGDADPTCPRQSSPPQRRIQFDPFCRRSFAPACKILLTKKTRLLPQVVLGTSVGIAVRSPSNGKPNEMGFRLRKRSAPGGSGSGSVGMDLRYCLAASSMPAA